MRPSRIHIRRSPATIGVVLAGLAVLAGSLVGCSGSEEDWSADDVSSFCTLTVEIDEIYDAADEAELTATAGDAVEERVNQLWALMPGEHRDDFRLRYWPVTDVSGLDTSGVRAQEAYDRMGTLFDQTCG